MKYTRRLVAVSIVCLMVVILCLSGLDFPKAAVTALRAGALSVESAMLEPVPQSPPASFSDDFNDNSLDTAKWNPNDLFSGFTNTNVPIAETAQRLEIGPLLQNVAGSSYRGIRTVNSYDFTGAYTYVELVQAPASNTAADAIFTIGNSVNAYYRMSVTAGNLKGVRNIGGTKTTLFSIPYDAVNHRFLRIRHVAATNSVTLDTAPGSGGVPGTWVQRYTETWSSSISTTGTLFEVKGGTSQVEANPPGKVIFDNFQFASNSTPPVNPPTVTAISPNSGPTTGGTSVTITGTGFSAGATMSLGGSVASNITVMSSTSITATTAAHAIGNVNVVVTNPDAQSATLYNGYTYTSGSFETVLIADDFNNNSLDTAKWEPNNLFSGFTDTNVPLAETGQRLEIGPLLQNASGSHYRGIRTVNTYNFSDAYSYVELVQAASSATQADAMFTVGNSVTAYYRLSVSAGSLKGVRNIGGTKTTLFSISYDAVNHHFLRIRHNATTGNVTLDTAAANGGAPGSWVQQYSEAWNSSISLTGMIFEVKGGTWQAEANAAGKVIFDNFKAATASAGGKTGLETSAMEPTTSVRFFKEVDDVDVATFAIGGLRDVGSGQLLVSGISGTIRNAYLYWHGPAFGSEGPPLGNAMLLDGFVVQGTLIGQSSDNFWGFPLSNAFRADVTSLVAALPNRLYFLSNFAHFPFFNPNGASLIILYNDASSTNNFDVSIYDGNDSNRSNVFDSDGWSIPLSNFQYNSGTALLQMHVADGQSIWVDPDVAINGLPFLTGNVFQGFSVPSGDGFFHPDNLWDRATFDVTSRVHQGTNTFNITSPPPDSTLKDALSLVVALVIVPSSNEVTSLAFETIDSQLTPNPNAGGGARIFPDLQTSVDTVNRRRVRVKATTTLGPNRTVFFRAFDVDDPSTNQAPVDTNAGAGNDNRGASATSFGGLSAASAQTDSNGVATVEFNTTMHPGDNFRIAASADQTYLNSLSAVGTDIKDSTGATLPTPKGKATEMLTVWRSLHIEVDSMGPVLNNYVKAKITSITQLPNSQHRIVLDRTIEPGRYFSASGVVQGVLMLLGPVTYNIVSNTATSVDIATPSGFPHSPNSTCWVLDDDDFNSNDNPFRGDDNEDVEALPETFSLVQESDDPNRNVFAPAYIRPVYDGGGSMTNNETNVPFQLNVLAAPASIDNQIQMGWDSEFDEHDDFWIVYLQLGYQGDIFEDTDPNSEGATGGICACLGLTNDVTGSAGVPLGGDGVLVFLETQQDRDLRGSDLKERSVPHELGHQMGLLGHDISVVEFGIMNPQGFLTFGPRHLNVLRWRVKSPGDN